MKVRELIQELKNFDQDAEVHFAYNYGDHWRTTVAPAVKSVDEYPVVYSEYHSMDKLVADDDEESFKRKEDRVAVILQAR